MKKKNNDNDNATHDALHVRHATGHHSEGPDQGAFKQPLALSKNNEKSQQLLHSKFITHNPKAGLNPLVDAAAYLFSIIGKLKQLKSYRNLQKLHQELIAEINTFQESIKALGYTPEYGLVSRYALCATLDDIISNTPWGGQGQWESYNLLNVFNQEKVREERFFLILERIVKDPALYIDLMEFMYICLSLGYKGSYSSTEFSYAQLEKITHALYKRIRAFHGNINKTLSPAPIKPTSFAPKKKSNAHYVWLITASVGCILVLFLGFTVLLDVISNKAYQELMQIGKSILYEPSKG